jgi:hypothetical protein
MVEYAESQGCISSAREPNSCTESWSTIAVEEPHRHEIFVADCEEKLPKDKNSVLSALDCQPGLELELSARDCQHSIVSLECQPGLSARDVGFPPGLELSPLEVGEALSQSTVHGTYTEAVSDESCSDLSDSTSMCESTDDAVIVKTGYSIAHEHPIPSPARLTELIQMKKHNVASIGSTHPLTTRCEPCSFHFTHIRMPLTRAPCKAAYLCEFCHNTSHNKRWRSVFRKTRRPHAL